MLNLRDFTYTNFTYTEETAFNWQLWERDIFDEEDSDYNRGGNERRSVRYVRSDITVFVSKPDIFGSYTLFRVSRPTQAKLFDISSRGVLLAGDSKLALRKNQTVKLTLIFNTNRMFEFPARVVREVTEQRKLYGVKFDQVNDELGDYLLESQTELIFRL